MNFLIPLFVAAFAQGSACRAIDGDSVLARDIARVMPGFSKLDGDFLVGYVPSSGDRRIFKAADLKRIAVNRGIELEGAADLCFARRTFIPDADQIRTAMGQSLGIADAKIEVLAQSQRAVPSGEIFFPRGGVQGGGSAEVTWQGFVQSGNGPKYPIWAKVRVTAKLLRVVATADLAARKPIGAEQLRVESTDDSPLDDTAVRDLKDAVGFLAKTKIAKSSVLRKPELERPMDVAFGDVIRVEVYAGGAHLTLEARAQTSGMAGSMITVRNLGSGRDFRAEVLGKDRARVVEGME